MVQSQPRQSLQEDVYRFYAVSIRDLNMHGFQYGGVAGRRPRTNSPQVLRNLRVVGDPAERLLSILIGSGKVL
jgi:hypothetical protein